MPSIHDPARRREMLDRLKRLAPDSPARWGKFTAPTMVLHLTDSLRMATGELAVRPRPLPLQFLIRPLVIYAFPFPKSVPTAPELLAREPVSWDADVAALHAAIGALEPPAPGARLPDHPAFGAMTARDWGHIIYKHVDHHFRQFGI